MPAPHVVAIVGATATGKTALAITLARALGGEIINADSRQVYRGMDIGTAKPTANERGAARHWLIDVADPDQRFSLADFLDQARPAMDDMRARGRTPIVAGGTGQYVWAVLEGWRVPRVPPGDALRADLAARAAGEGTQALVDDLRAIDPASADAIDPRNVRRIIRAIEVTKATGRPFSAWRADRLPAPSATILGLRIERAALYRRIDERVDAMLAAGLEEEVRGLVEAGYRCELAAMSGIGYRQICEYLAGTCTLAEAAARMKTETHRLARMQHAWFGQEDPRIHWLDAESPSLAGDAEAAVREATKSDEAALS